MATSFPLEDFEHLVWIKGFYTSLEPSRTDISFSEGFVKGWVEVLEEMVEMMHNALHDALCTLPYAVHRRLVH
jgi:hypothetical protein